MLCCFMRKLSSLGVLAGLWVPVLAGGKELPEPLERFRWEYRVLLVFENPEAIPALRRAEEEVGDRQIVWFAAEGGQWKTNWEEELPQEFAQGLSRYHRTGPGKPEVVLLGKDGGEKCRGRNFDLAAIFALIDSMPMRREEIRRGAGSRR